MLLSIWQFLISFIYYIDYKQSFEAIVNKFDTFIVIYDQFKFISDPSSNVRKVTR
jgi:hypothetical protein